MEDVRRLRSAETGGMMIVHGPAAVDVAIQVDEVGSTFTVWLVGQELDDLTTENFTGTNVADINYTPATGVLTGKAMTASGTVRIAVENTTIGTLNVTIEDDYDPNA